MAKSKKNSEKNSNRANDEVHKEQASTDSQHVAQNSMMVIPSNGNIHNGDSFIESHCKETRDSLANESSSDNQDGKIRKYYRKLKFKNDSYILGDNVYLKDDSDRMYYGKITKIFAKWEDEGYEEIRNEPVFEVLWYYTKNDLDISKLGMCEEDLECIGDNELFPATHIDIIPCRFLIGKFEIITFDEYQRLPYTNLLTYYTRAKYNPLLKKLTPDFKDWPVSCICKKPTNPNSLYIGCEICEQWFHPQCSGLTIEKAANLDKFYCSSCKIEQNTPRTRSKNLKDCSKDEIDDNQKISDKKQRLSKNKKQKINQDENIV